MGDLLTVDIIAGAIGNSPEYSHMNGEECRNLAEHIMNFFGYQDRILDNVLHPEDRDTFYMLEDSGLMETEREEITLYDGREWRIHYWGLKTSFIHWRAGTKPPEPVKDDDKYSIYGDIEAEIWKGREVHA